MKKLRIIILFLIAGLLAALPVTADEHHGKGKRGENEQDEHEEGHKHDEDRKQGEHKKFSDEERDRIRSYCDQFGKMEGKHQRPLPPGLAKKLRRGRHLPPGWEDNCRPGQTMPEEVYHECRPLPRELAVKLPIPPSGTVTVAVDGRVVRLIEATREILDVFDVHVRL